ncbi:arrestin domain-containing protein 3-like [Elysia marginata]|uniref:Arrestin domain-containing protein 3-like n=1 Tax=Elysia marginata TaxID=1093978 RepID=A0AAV4G8A0_9GAST|nr:arrestin domain-containing protein 3-like [Elysia marginata]
MRVELFEVHFNNSNSIYIGGQTVSGKVVVKLTKATWIDSIDIKFTGRAKSKWDVSNGDSSKQYKATEVYIDSEHHLYRCRGENDLQPAGLHMYPFDFTLPSDVPSSFEGRRGFVRYLCVVTLDRGWKGVLQIEQDLTVIRHLDLNQVPHAGVIVVVVVVVAGGSKSRNSSSRSTAVVVEAAPVVAVLMVVVVMVVVVVVVVVVV